MPAGAFAMRNWKASSVSRSRVVLSLASGVAGERPPRLQHTRRRPPLPDRMDPPRPAGKNDRSICNATGYVVARIASASTDRSGQRLPPACRAHVTLLGGGFGFGHSPSTHTIMPPAQRFPGVCWGRSRLAVRLAYVLPQPEPAGRPAAVWCVGPGTCAQRDHGLLFRPQGWD
jgi:hypothetical protein